MNIEHFKITLDNMVFMFKILFRIKIKECQLDKIKILVKISRIFIKIKWIKYLHGLEAQSC